jgi:membrane protein implicated in regulation of membrane protease activity
VLTLAYLVFLVLGCGYVGIMLLLGHGSFGDVGGGGGHHADVGDTSSYGVDGGGHGSVSADAGGAVAFHFPLFSPLALATLLGAIGAWGLIALKGFHASEEGSLLFAVPAALLTAYGISYVGWRLVSSSRGSSQIRLADLEGARGEVTTPIPEGGIGEVAAMVQGQRFSGPARAGDGRALPRGTAVTVTAMMAGTMVVAAGTPKER